jgi:hypothetical protein
MPHVPDDIYFYILDIFEKEFKAAEADIKKPQGKNIVRKNIRKCIEYDLPNFESKNSKVWDSRQYGLPYKVIESHELCWIKDGWNIHINTKTGRELRLKCGYPMIHTRVDKLPTFKIDF